jgi:hypothetical protein
LAVKSANNSNIYKQGSLEPWIFLLACDFCSVALHAKTNIAGQGGQYQSVESPWTEAPNFTGTFPFWLSTFVAAWVDVTHLREILLDKTRPNFAANRCLYLFNNIYALRTNTLVCSTCLLTVVVNKCLSNISEYRCAAVQTDQTHNASACKRNICT